MGDPDVANAPLLFPFPQCRKLCIYIDEIMHLHEVDPVHAQKRHGTFDRLNSTLLSPSPNFVARNSFSRIPSAEVRSPITSSAQTVHWRRINHTAAQLYKERQNVFQLPPDVRSEINIEGPPRSEADHGKFLTRGRNDARQHR